MNDREYRKALGFTAASKAKIFFTAKDICNINWTLIESYNERLVDIFDRIQSTLPFSKQNFSIIIQSAYDTIRQYDILPSLTNHGRAPESVYYSWMQGYLSAILFKSLIESELNCKLIQNGADDLSNPSTFSRKSDPDLVDTTKKLFVEVQAGFRGSDIDIKRSKIKTSNDAEYYIACFDCFHGQYVIINTKELLSIPENLWYENPRWEGTVCYTIPKEQLKSWRK